MTIAVASALGLAILVAFTTAIWVAVTEGAVKSPELEIFPIFTVHSTAVSLVPRKLDVNCSVLPEDTVVMAGESVRFTAGKRRCERPTVNESCLSPLLLARSVTDTTNEYLLAAVGRPEINPVVAFNSRPGGRVPPEIENLYGAVPPVTEMEVLYGLSRIAEGNPAVIKMSCGAEPGD